MTSREVQAIKARHRRAERNAAGVCINGPVSGFVGWRGTEHGPVVSGGKCQRCHEVHARTSTRRATQQQEQQP